MQIRVYLRQEDPASCRPQHSASKTLALLVISFNAARKIDEDTIQLISEETWRECKDRCRRIRSSKCKAVIQDSGMPLMLSYPPMGQESDARERQKRLWLAAERF